MQRYFRGSKNGFTIVELLIVIVVIGILAAVTILGFSGIQDRAKISALQADLTNSTKLLDVYKAGTSSTSTYPVANDCTASPAPNTICLTPSSGTVYQYTYDAPTNTFCLSAVNGTLAYHVSSLEGTPTSGVCSGHTSPTSVAYTPSAGVVTLVAGSGTGAFLNGTAATARFSNPNDIAIDSTGNIYVADLYNHRIRKIDTSGVVTTLAGSGSASSNDGTGTAATFNYPEGIDVDSAGNVYVVELYGNKVRKITSAGVVTTLAGSGTAGTANGTGAAATFSGPRGIAVSSSGDVYVADSSNNKIRKVTSAGVVTTFAGSGASGSANGTGAAATFNGPFAVAVDSAGNVYTADNNGNVIRKITSAGVVTTLAGSGVAGFAEGAGTAAQFSSPNGIAVDSAGVVYVADSSNHRIRKITPSGVVTTLAGSGVAGYADGTGAAAQFSGPRGVEVTPAGVVYIADGSNHRIRIAQ